MKNKIKILFGNFFLLGILALAFTASAATIFTDNFNSYTNGNVEGQGGWMGNGVNEFFTVESSVVHEGANALQSSGNFPTVGLSVRKTGTLTSTGSIKYYVRADSGAPYSRFRLTEGFSLIVDVVFNVKSHVVYYTNGFAQNVILGNVDADTWYPMVIEWRDSDKKVRYSFNDSAFTPYVSPYSSWTVGLDGVSLYLDVGGATAHIYYDDIQEFTTTISKTPVLIVPGLTGTNLRNDNELLWLNSSKLAGDLSDSFMDPLMFDQNLNPSDADVLTLDVIRNQGGLNYTESLITELKNQGYVENQTLFTFPYDWRYGVTGKYSDGKTNVDLLQQKIADIMAQTGSNTIDVVAHSMGGLIVKKYVMDNSAINHIGKAVFVGVPSTGAPYAVKDLLVGDNLGSIFVNQDEIKKISGNMPAIYDLLPSQQYYNTKGSYVKVVDQGFTGLNTTTKDLTHDEANSFLTSDHSLNPAAVINAENLHTATFDNFDMRTTGIDLYAIDGCKAGTLGKIIEVRSKSILGQSIINYQKPKIVPGDGTVPLESSTNLPIDASHKFYSLTGVHSTMMSQEGSRQEIVNLLAGSSLAVGNSITQDISRCELNGKAISVFSPVDIFVTDQAGNKIGLAADGSIINEIPNADFEIWGEHKFLYLPTDDGQIYNITMDGTGSGTYTIKTDDIQNGDVVKTEVFSNLPVTTDLTGTVNLGAGQTTLVIVPTPGASPQTILPSSTITGNATGDVLPPISNATITNSPGGAVATINAQDSGSGVLNVSYSLDGGAYQKVTGNSINITVTTLGAHTITYFSTDNVGNNESEKSTLFTVYNYSFTNLTKSALTQKDIKSANTVPVKFQMINSASGLPVPDLSATLMVNGKPAQSSGGANVANIFRYDAINRQYVYNLATKLLLVGTNKLIITVAGVGDFSLAITLK